MEIQFWGGCNHLTEKLLSHFLVDIEYSVVFRPLSGVFSYLRSCGIGLIDGAHGRYDLVGV